MKYILTVLLSLFCMATVVQATLVLTDLGTATPGRIYTYAEYKKEGSSRIVGYDGDYSAGQRLNLDATGDAAKPFWQTDKIIIGTANATDRTNYDAPGGNALAEGTRFSVWDLGENNILERDTDEVIFSEAITAKFATQYLGAWIEFDLGTQLTLNPADNLAFTIDIKQVEDHSFAAFFMINRNLSDGSGDHMYNDVVDTTRDMLFVIPATPVAVPEPATAMMLFFGGGIGFAVHRLRRWANR